MDDFTARQSRLVASFHNTKREATQRDHTQIMADLFVDR